MPDCSHCKHERELREQWERLHLEKHRSDELAVTTARNAIDQRLGEMNELRAQISSERGSYIQRDFYDERHNALRDGMDTRLKMVEQKLSNYDGRIYMLGGFITLIVVAVEILMRYFGKS